MAGGLTWVRKPPLEHERGGPSYCLTTGKRELIRVRPVIDDDGKTIAGWWWSGLNKNTAHRVIATLEDAKREAMAHAVDVLSVAKRAEQGGRWR